MFTEPVIGYRSWHVSAGTYELISPVVHKHTWPVDHEAEAQCEKNYRISDKTCLMGDHETPTMGCRCGFYAWHEVSDAITRYSTSERCVVGAVICWGRFVVAPAGFRIQYMRPLALAEHKTAEERGLGWSSLFEQVLEKYGIPLVPLDVLEEYALTWGKPMGTEFTQ